MSTLISPYFIPDNGGVATPERYATHRYLDYQKNSLATITSDADIQAYTTLDATKLEQLIANVDAEMKSAGLTDGFAVDLGDLNGDGTGDGNSSGNDATIMLGNIVKTKHPSVTKADGTSVERVELFTRNDRGLRTTYTDPEGNVTAYLYYPENDPEGDGQYIADLSNKQYGRLKETHRDVDPALIMTLVGDDGDLADFDTTVEPRVSRTNTPGEYQNVVTGNEATAGCATCSYDAMGNVLAETDARGFTTTYDRDELGRVYRVTSPTPYNFRMEKFYDANGNVTRIDVEDKVVDYITDDPADELFANIQPIVNLKSMIANLPMKAGDGGTVRPGWFTSLFEYDLVDNKISEDIDATGSSQTSLLTTYEYDANSCLVKITKPEGNIIEYDYDERNLQIAQRVGYVEDEFDGIVTVTVYDKNGNIKYQLSDSDHDGVSDNNGSVTINDAFGSGEVLLHVADIAAEKTYDGFNRVIEIVDAIGNRAEYTYDPIGNAIQVETYGPVGGASPTSRIGTNNTLLARFVSRYDEAGQMYESQRDVFIASGISLPSSRAITHTPGGLVSNSTANDHTTAAILTSAGDSYVLSRSEFDRAGRLAKTIADNTSETIYEYDGMSRVIKVTDALGNIVENTYDAAGNVIKSTRTETCTIDSGITAEVFESGTFYDCMGRAIISANQGPDGSYNLDFIQDNSTIISFAAYDSRGNMILAVDPKGNTSVNVYDGAGRILETIQHVRKDGNGDKGPAEDTSFLPAAKDAIRTQVMYDANSRQIRIVDNTGAVASGSYDTADRPVKIEFHDGTTRMRTYSGSLMSTYTDENTSVFTFTHDAAGRKTAIAISKATGVEGTTSQTFQYDGLSRLTQATDSDGTNTSTVNTYYDSLSRVLEDSQTYGGNTRNVTHSEFKSYALGELTYPNARTVENTYDDLYRLTQKADTASIVNWEYFGQSRLAEMRLANGLCATWMNNARTQSAMQDGRTEPAWGDADDTRFGYDGSGRMIAKRFIDSTLNGTDEYDDATPVAGFTTEYDKTGNKLYERQLHDESKSHLYPGLDSKNRLREYQRGTLASGGESIATPIALANTFESFKWELDSVGNWANITIKPQGGSESTTNRTHNKLHQVINDGTNALTYDANGNLTSDGSKTFTWDAFNRMVEAEENSSTIGSYVYDALGRRIRKTADSTTTDFLYDGMQCVEERVSDSMTKQYIWGQYIDEVLQVKTTSATYYPLQDLLYRTNKLTTDSGSVHESYDCDAYGRTLMFDSSSQAITAPTCEFIFTGRRYDSETSLYYYRARYYSPELGRFISKDPLGYVDGMSLYEYAATLPATMLDPYGFNTIIDAGPRPAEPEYKQPGELDYIWSSINTDINQPEINDSAEFTNYEPSIRLIDVEASKSKCKNKFIHPLCAIKSKEIAKFKSITTQWLSNYNRLSRERKISKYSEYMLKIVKAYINWERAWQEYQDAIRRYDCMEMPWLEPKEPNWPSQPQNPIYPDDPHGPPPLGPYPPIWPMPHIPNPDDDNIQTITTHIGKSSGTPGFNMENMSHYGTSVSRQKIKTFFFSILT